jgi:hypothetical protein
MSAANQDARQRWSRSAMIAFERLPLPYPIIVILVGVLGAAEQVLELRFSVGQGNSNAVSQAITFVVILVYTLMSLRFLKQKALSALFDLRPAVLISDEAYDRHVQRMLSTRRGVELGLVAAATGIVVPLLMLDADLMNAVIGKLGARAIFMLAFMVLTWAFLGWLLLSLGYASIRQARALGALAHCPLAFNIYDPSSLFPFGRLSLWHGLVITGLVMIPLILLGMPTQAGFLVVGVSIISLLAVFIPLWGVHEQISSAKAKALSAMNSQLFEVQAQWLNPLNHSADESKRMSDRINMLLTLRKVASESPSWPFKSEAALVRAVIAAASPLIYFFVNQLILRFLLSGGIR